MLPQEYVNTKYDYDFIDFLNDRSDEKIFISPRRQLRFLDKFAIVNPNVYIDISRLIYAKRRYSDFIVSIYLESLFWKNIYSPKEVLKFFEQDIGLLIEIYFFMLAQGCFMDLDGCFLMTFLEDSDLWLKAYTEYFWNEEKSRNDIEQYQINAIWKPQNYQKYFDYIFYHRPMEERCF